MTPESFFEAHRPRGQFHRHVDEQGAFIRSFPLFTSAKAMVQIMNIQSFLGKSLLVTSQDGKVPFCCKSQCGKVLYPWGMYTVVVEDTEITISVNAPDGAEYLCSKDGGISWEWGSSKSWWPVTLELL